jgi:hypothetical protein
LSVRAAPDRFSCRYGTSDGGRYEQTTQGKGEMKADEQEKATSAYFRQKKESHAASLPSAAARPDAVYGLYLLALPAYDYLFFRHIVEHTIPAVVFRISKCHCQFAKSSAIHSDMFFVKITNLKLK